MEKNNKLVLFNKGAKKSLIDQYQIYVSWAEKISDRRQIANNYYITLTTLLISGIGYIWAQGFSIFLNYMWPLLGICIAYIRFINLRAYKQINSKKFEIIHQIEEKLPMNLYSYEREKLWKWEDKKLYYPFSHIEILIPKIMIGLYVLWILYISYPSLCPIIKNVYHFINNLLFWC